MSGQTNPIDLAVKEAGSLTKLADALGLSVQVVSNWKSRGVVPIDRCVAIERATGGVVTRRELRPDDWRTIWPELADRKPVKARA